MYVCTSANDSCLHVNIGDPFSQCSVKPSVTLVKPPQQTSNHSKQFLRSKNKTPSTLHKSRNMQHDGRGGSISKRRGEAKGVLDGMHNNVGAIGGRESLRFPEIPTLPALVSLRFPEIPTLVSLMFPEITTLPALVSLGFPEIPTLLYIPSVYFCRLIQ